MTSIKIVLAVRALDMPCTLSSTL